MRTRFQRHRTAGAAHGCCRTRGAAAARASGGGRRLCARAGLACTVETAAALRRCGAAANRPAGTGASSQATRRAPPARKRAWRHAHATACTAAALRRSRQRSASARHDLHTEGVELRVLERAAGERLLATHTTHCDAAHLLVTSGAAAHKAASACATHTATRRRATITPKGGPGGPHHCYAVLQPATGALLRYPPVSRAARGASARFMPRVRRIAR